MMGVLNEQDGSFLVAGALFMFMFMTISAFGIDLSHYMLIQQRTQNAADGAALAGGVALNQYTDTPDTSKAYDAVLRHIHSAQGEKFRDMYDRRDPRIVDHIMIAPVNTNGDTVYRVGVIAFDKFTPIFLPRSVFGKRNELVMQTTVAEVTPTPRSQLVQIPINCAIIAGHNPGNGDVEIDGNNFGVDGGGLCSNANIEFDRGKDDDFAIFQYERGACDNRGANCPDRTTLKDRQALPRFRYDTPDP